MNDSYTNGMKCPLDACKGKLLNCNDVTTTYSCAIPMKCNICNITRYMCKLCLLSPGSVRIGNKSIFVRSEMWRHNHRHLKHGDLNTNIGTTDNTFDKDNRRIKSKEKCDKKPQSEVNVLKENICDSSADKLNFDFTSTEEENTFLPSSDLTMNQGIKIFMGMSKVMNILNIMQQ